MTELAKGAWPALPLDGWRETYATLHMCTQIVGKIRLACSPLVNEWWNVPLYVTTRGLGTTPMPYGDRTFEIDFDFVDHELYVRTSEGKTRALPLLARSVADFYYELFGILDELDISVHINPKPAEIPDPIPCDHDRVHHHYDAAAVERFFTVLRHVDVVFKEFRSRFYGKCSPVHFFWGSFDLAVSRFSGRRAPPRANADRINRVAYDQEVSSVDFWPGTGDIGASFYAYMAPEPPGFATGKVLPPAARYDANLKEWLLSYADVCASADPVATILDFAQSTYELGASLARWDRDLLEARAA
ncbi:MAG: DUF5996 family protein [Polyangiales bacterium]